MKKLLFFVSVISPLAGEINTQQIFSRRCPECIKEDDRVTTVVIANWVAMIGHVVKIAKDPHNSHNVGNEISQILHSIANVVQEVTKRGGNNPDTQELLNAIHAMLAELPETPQIYAALHRL